MAGLKIELPKFNMPKLAAGAQKASPAAVASHQPAATAQAPKTDGLASFKNALSSGQIKSNLNQPALPQTAAKTQKFGGWVG